VDDPVAVWSIGTDGAVTFTVGDQTFVITRAEGLAAFTRSAEQAVLCRSTFDSSGYDAARHFADGVFGRAGVPDGDLASVLDHTGDGIQVVNIADLEHQPLATRYQQIVDRLYDTRLQNHLEALHELRDPQGSEAAWLRVYAAAERERVVIERD